MQWFYHCFAAEIGFIFEILNIVKHNSGGEPKMSKPDTYIFGQAAEEGRDQALAQAPKFPIMSIKVINLVLIRIWLIKIIISNSFCLFNPNPSSLFMKVVRIAMYSIRKLLSIQAEYQVNCWCVERYFSLNTKKSLLLVNISGRQNGYLCLHFSPQEWRVLLWKRYLLKEFKLVFEDLLK